MPFFLQIYWIPSNVLSNIPPKFLQVLRTSVFVNSKCLTLISALTCYYFLNRTGTSIKTSHTYCFTYLLLWFKWNTYLKSQIKEHTVLYLFISLPEVEHPLKRPNERTHSASLVYFCTWSRTSIQNIKWKNTQCFTCLFLYLK